MTNNPEYTQTEEMTDKEELNGLKSIELNDVSKAKEERRRAFKWQYNHDKITETFAELLEACEGKKIPSLKDIAKHMCEVKGIQISYATVLNHFQTLEFKPMESPFRTLTPMVLLNLFNLTQKNPAAVKLWLQVMEGWDEEVIIRHAGKIEVGLPEDMA